MAAGRYIDAVCVVMVLAALLVTALFIHGEELGLERIVDADAEESRGTAYFTDNDQRGSWDAGRATQIRLNGERASVSGGGAYVYEGNVVISSAGKYRVSGELYDGSIVVDTDGDAKVWIMLDGVTISCYDGACLRVEQADKVFLTLADGSENRLSSAFAEKAEGLGVDGAVFSRDDLTINGSGSLKVVSATQHGIVSNDELVITGGEIRVEAARDALHANDGLRVKEAALSLDAYDDGIALTGEESELYIESGRMDICCTDNALSAEDRIHISGGEISIDAGNDGISAVGSVDISGGTLAIRAYDDAIHSDTSVTVSGGRIDIQDCFEGIEAVVIDISGGEIAICPIDDGMNATRKDGMHTQIRISGGDVRIVNRDAVGTDGLDANGDILITGGRILIDLGEYEGNSAIDCTGELSVTGGEIVTDMPLPPAADTPST